jgi:hypothetical protein
MQNAASRLRARFHATEKAFYAALTGSDYDRYAKVYVEHRRLLAVLLNPERAEREGRISLDSLADFLWGSRLLPDKAPERWVQKVLGLFKKLPFVTYLRGPSLLIFNLFAEAQGGLSLLEKRRERARKLRNKRKRRCVKQADICVKPQDLRKVTPYKKNRLAQKTAPEYNASKEAKDALFVACRRLPLGDNPADGLLGLPPSQPPLKNTTPLGGACPDNRVLEESRKPGFDPRRCETVVLPSRLLTRTDFDEYRALYPFLAEMRWSSFRRNRPEITSTLNAILLVEAGVRKGSLLRPCGALVVAEGRLRGVRDERWRVAS